MWLRKERRREGHKDQKARERKEQEEDGRSGRPKEARKNEGPPGRDEQKKPDEVCLQLARPLEPALEKRISCLWAIMYLDMLGGGTKHSCAIIRVRNFSVRSSEFFYCKPKYNLQIDFSKPTTGSSKLGYFRQL